MEIFFLPKKYGICHCVWWAWNCNRHDKRSISNSAYIYSLIYVHVLETICVHVVITSVCSSSVSFSSRFSSVYWHVWMNTAIKHNFHKSLINRQKKVFGTISRLCHTLSYSYTHNHAFIIFVFVVWLSFDGFNFSLFIYNTNRQTHSQTRLRINHIVFKLDLCIYQKTTIAFTFTQYFDCVSNDIYLCTVNMKAASHCVS